jgi:hypothetical protein
VELDLLRSGRRLTTHEPLTPADYYAFVCRGENLPHVEVYEWMLQDRLPVIPVPLALGDADVPLDLQAAFTKTYNRSSYDYALDYGAPLEPPVNTSQARNSQLWVRSFVSEAD